MEKQRYVASGSGARRSTRDKQMHVRVTDDQLARYQLAAEAKGQTLSRWVVEHLDAASTPAKGKRVRSQRRASAYNYGDDE